MVRNLMKENGDLTENDTETANHLQKFFLSTFTHEDETTTPELPLKIVEYQMEDLTITRQEVCNLMNSLKEDKSPGVDNVHPKVLSRCHETLSHPLQLIFSRVGVKYSTCTWYFYLSTYLSVLDVLEYLVYGNVKVLVLVLVLDQKVLGTYK